MRAPAAQGSSPRLVGYCADAYVPQPPYGACELRGEGQLAAARPPLYVRRTRTSPGAYAVTSYRVWYHRWDSGGGSGFDLGNATGVWMRTLTLTLTLTLPLPLPLTLSRST